MPSNSFPSRVSHVTKGSPVSAGNTGAAGRALEARTNYLREVLTAVESGQVLVHRDATVASDVLEGQPVFWNSTTQRYEKALAGVESDGTNGVLAPTAASDVLGLVWVKTNATKADIVVGGLVKFASLTNAITGDVVPGRYYLSAVTAGKLVRQRPAVTVAVCVVLGPLDACDENTWVYVQPQMRDFLEDHIHYQFHLAALPAGTTTLPAFGEAHVISDPDEFQRGWLPAEHGIFDGNAPTGAAFGYNLSQHVELQRVWPPIPLTAALLEMFKPDDGMIAGGRIPAEKVVFDSNGIWWMTDCYGEVPWPTAYTGASSSSSAAPSASSSSEGAVCPLPAPMDLILSFIKMTFATDRSVVTSLEPDTGQPLAFVNCDGDPATTGALKARLVLALLEDDDEVYGGRVLKEINANSRFGAGYVLEGLIAGSDRVSLASTRQRYETPDDEDSAVVHQGLTTVDVNLDPTERELPPEITRLGDALERMYRNIPYVGLPSGRNSGVRLRFNVPPAGLPTNPQMQIRVVLFGLGDGTMTDLNTSYYRLARPTDAAPTPLTEGDTSLDLATDIEVDASAAVEITSEQFDVAPGDTVMISIDREADGEPTYDFEIGLIRVGGIIVAAEV